MELQIPSQVLTIFVSYDITNTITDSITIPIAVIPSSFYDDLSF